MADGLKRGDRVRYSQKTYFFRPNGSSCYLFLDEGDMDDIKKAAHAVPRTKVELYVPQPTASHWSERRHPLSVSDEETDQAEALIRALSPKPVYRIVETKVLAGVYASQEEAEAARPPSTDTATYRIVRQ